MDREQLLLTKLAEECSEVAQITLKAQQFGLQEREPSTSFNNAERMHLELNDLLAIVEMLNDECGLGFEPDKNLISAKKAKVNKFAFYSAELGRVSNGNNQD